MAAKKDDKDPVATAAETAGQGLNQAAEVARRQAEQARSLLGQGTRLYSDMGELSREDIGGLIESSARLAKGAQDVSWEMLSYTQQSLQMGLKAANEMMTCRTVEDMLNVHRNFMRQSMDSFLQESVKLMEISAGTAGTAAQPVMQRFGTRQ
ncbi:MAG TPA: phasin family protein [Magnetospirillum sp.]|jgi:hypothetical protein|nr:phasin family protein [Magnetospirillum sp.]